MALSKRNAFTAGKNCISVKFVLLCTVHTAEIEQFLYKNTSQTKSSFKFNVWFVQKTVDCKKVSPVTEGKLFQLEVEINPQKYFLWKQDSGFGG